MKDKQRGALYIRVSSGEQTEYSPDSQLKLGKKFAKEHDIELLQDHIYFENGVSGRNASKRNSFQKMIAVAKTKPKPFDVILIYDFSRFARNKEEAVMYKALLRKKLGIDVVSITQPLSEGKESVILESMYEAMDEYYSLNLSENVHRGRIEKAERGEWNGRAPYGYDYDKKNKTLKINDEEAKIVKMIFNKFNGNIRQITNDLNTMKIKNKNSNAFNDRTVKRILTSPVYNGKVTNGKDNIFEGKHKKIIDDKLWNITMKKMNQYQKTNIKYRNKKVKYDSWLRGLVKCSKCGHSLIVCESKNSKPYFQCGFYSKNECKVSHYINIERLENIITEELKNTFTNKININISNINEDINSEISVLENKLKNIKQKEKRIKLAYQDGIDTLEEYKENKKELLKEKEELEILYKKYNVEEKKKEHKNNIYKKSEELYKILNDEKCDIKLKKELANLLFEKIVYNKPLNTIEIIYK